MEVPLRLSNSMAGFAWLFLIVSLNGSMHSGWHNPKGMPAKSIK